MIKPRRWPWPPEMGPNTPHDRARTIARAYRALIVKWAPRFEIEVVDVLTAKAAAARFRAELDALDAMTDRFGESVWLLPRLDTTEPGRRLTRAAVAELAHVDPDTVTSWCDRGLRGVRLTRGPDGLYDPREVDAFLRHRDNR